MFSIPLPRSLIFFGWLLTMGKNTNLRKLVLCLAAPQDISQVHLS